ncbi:DUF3817 domain-containing protein [Fluviicola chungangensis]|uniref:DUF3817 domain-containing protein n=1 Tax=Fluviicola chungangensis TaxID=2597671 RepID=A0A556N7C7_9FLAO|nr:DUF3817 domain-containing protein [Fluviicola chungangensis]TSJ47929.1 DUF3817 domain-containing protein [Fluviicola chungangensis]
MIRFIQSKVDRLRLIGFLEGISLLVLLFIALPLKYSLGIPEFSKVIGTIHGALFLLFIFNTLSVGVEYQWKFKETTWKVLLACIVPLGTFYIDRKILRRMRSSNNK